MIILEADLYMYCVLFTCIAILDLQGKNNLTQILKIYIQKKVYYQKSNPWGIFCTWTKISAVIF